MPTPCGLYYTVLSYIAISYSYCMDIHVYLAHSYHRLLLAVHLNKQAVHTLYTHPLFFEVGNSCQCKITKELCMQHTSIYMNRKYLHICIYIYINICYL